jgi:Dehydrogenases with different specificities (related to short-chain alcohol dehydrogenases)
VTGGARRIGRAIALDLAAHGWAVAIHHRDSESDAAEVVEAVTAHQGRAIAVAADLRSEEAIAALVDTVATALGPITCLVNNASVFEYDSPETVTKESWDLHMQVNLRAPFLLVQGFLRQLPQGATGNVINILDQRVWNLTPHFTSYTVSKAGLWTLTQTLAMALAPRVRVNGIGPGPTLPSKRQSAEHFRRQWMKTPLARQVTPEEICAAVRYFLSAPSVTGQMIAVCSGQHLGWVHGSREEGAEE